MFVFWLCGPARDTCRVLSLTAFSDSDLCFYSCNGSDHLKINLICHRCLFLTASHCLHESSLSSACLCSVFSWITQWKRTCERMLLSLEPLLGFTKFCFGEVSGTKTKIGDSPFRLLTPVVVCLFKQSKPHIQKMVASHPAFKTQNDAAVTVVTQSKEVSPFLLYRSIKIIFFKIVF